MGETQPWPTAIENRAEIEIIELHVRLDQISSQHLTGLVQTQREQIRLLTWLPPATGDAQ